MKTDDGTMRERLQQLRKRIDQWFFGAVAMREGTGPTNQDAAEPAAARRLSGVIVVPSTREDGHKNPPTHNQPEEERP